MQEVVEIFNHRSHTNMEGRSRTGRECFEVGATFLHSYLEIYTASGRNRSRCVLER